MYSSATSRTTSPEPLSSKALSPPLASLRHPARPAAAAGSLASAERFGHRLERLAAPQGLSTPKPIQRLISSANFQTRFSDRSSWLGLRSAYSDPSFQAIHDSIHSFHNVPEDVRRAGGEAVNHYKLRHLHEAEHQAYQWHHTNRANPGHAQMGNLKTLLDDIQAEHKKEITKTVDKGYKLWTPTRATMNKKQRQKLDNLWSATTTGRDLRGQNSKLKILNESRPGPNGKRERYDDFHRDIHAHTARLLSGPQGRELVSDLVYGDKATHIRPAHSTDRADFAYVTPGLNEHKSPGQEREATKEAYAIEDPHAPGGFRRRQGVGSQVTVNPGLTDTALSHRDETARDITGQGQGNAILSPAFLIYAHELGHARNNLRGQNRIKHLPHLYDANRLSQQRVNNRLALGNVVPPPGQELLTRWRNPEEHQNITQTENPVRDEHGLSRRKYLT